MAIGKATQTEILLAIQQRLRDRVDGFSEATCFYDDEPFPLIMPPHEVFCTIAPTDSTFPQEFFTGGGEETLTEASGVTVTVFRLCNLDQPDRAEVAMLEPERGLLTKFKLQILKALLKDAWEPERGTTQLLRNQLSPASASAPRRYEGSKNKWTYMSITFNTDFDWNLD